MTASTSPVAGQRETPVGNPLFEYVLRIADDRLVLGHRLSEWCGHGPILEEDIALSNIALDLIGQATALLALAGKVEAQGRDEDALAYFRDERDFRSALLVEQPNGEFVDTIVRQFLFDAWSVLHLDALAACGHEELAALAAKSLKEDTYHLRHSSEWVLRLGDGTAESHARVQRALDELWRFTGELFESDAVDAAVAKRGIAIDRAAIQSRWRELVADVVTRATLALPADAPMATGGRRGRHSEHLGHMLAEMQIVARSHPDASW
jgi:ring-1,2-phenylacetyl-CoA epoxidase subunit PaaC